MRRGRHFNGEVRHTSQQKGHIMPQRLKCVSLTERGNRVCLSIWIQTHLTQICGGNVNLALRSELAEDEVSISDRVDVWENYRDDITIAILMAKVRSYRDILDVLARTHDAILAFVDRRKSWGCGTDNEDAVQRSLTQWVHSNPEENPENWVPFGNWCYHQQTW